ncbi:MAG: hypothetical protein RL693_2438 [Verrucomicrobiota bacterium]|jgi:hypothetical protein
MKKTILQSKSKAVQSSLLCAAIAAALSIGSAQAGTPAKAPVVVEPKETPFVTGNITLNYDTHFISYGQDVWGAGMDWGDSLFHPSIELDFAVAENLQFYVNVWADVNDLADSNIGKYVQEVDLNVGFYYTMDKFKFQLGYGAWMYADQTESVIDAKVSYSGFYGLNPFLAIHARPDIGDNIGLDTGLVGQLGIAPGTTLGPVALTFPVTVSFDTDGFHGGGSGFAYVSAGVAASIPVTKHISIGLAAIYYHTNDSVIATNPDSDFVTGTAGFTVAF